MSSAISNDKMQCFHNSQRSCELSTHDQHPVRGLTLPEHLLVREFWIFIAHSVSDFPRKGLPPSAGASFVVFTLRLWLDFIEFVRTHKEIDMKNAVIFDLDGTLLDATEKATEV